MYVQTQVVTYLPEYGDVRIRAEHPLHHQVISRSKLHETHVWGNTLLLHRMFQGFVVSTWLSLVTYMLPFSLSVIETIQNA